MDKQDNINTISQEITVDRGQSPIRIDVFLLNKLEFVTRNRIQSAIKEGKVLVNDKIVKPNYKVRPLDSILLEMPGNRDESKGVEPEDIPLKIIYEDDDLLVLDKEPGMVVHPGISNYSGTLVNALSHYLKDEDLPILAGNKADRAGLVHRIDKNTTGLLVIAKNDDTLSHLAKQFFDHSVKREYVALVWGNFDEKSGTYTGNIDRHPKHRKQRAVFPEGDKGKHAITHYEVLEDFYYVSLVKCRLETGRTHQIRVHMSHFGHPVFNDPDYGGDQIIKGTVFTKYKQYVQNCFNMMPRHALHAKSLGFIHPKTGEQMHFEIPVPEDFAAVVEKWRNYLSGRKKSLEHDFQ
jgi:23S rRNA pseudouridine1911/1915/1917 synthase